MFESKRNHVEKIQNFLHSPFYDIFSAVALHNLVTSTGYGFSAKYPGLCERSVKPSLNEVHVRRCQIDDCVF